MVQPSWIIIAIIIGLLVALIVTGVLRAELKSVGKQHSADMYKKEQGLNLTTNRDVFLYKNVERVAKPKEQPRQAQPGQGNKGGPR